MEKVFIQGSDGFYLCPDGSLLMEASEDGSCVKILPNAYEFTEYPYWDISFSGTWRHIPCHILMAETFLTKPTSFAGTLVVNHKDGNKFNYTLSNLEWITQSENVLHAMRHGLCSNATALDTVKHICVAIDSGMGNQEIAKLYNVHHSTVCAIRNGRRWQQVAQEYIFSHRWNNRYSKTGT